MFLFNSFASQQRIGNIVINMSTYRMEYLNGSNVPLLCSWNNIYLSRFVHWIHVKFQNKFAYHAVFLYELQKMLKVNSKIRVKLLRHHCNRRELQLFPCWTWRKFSPLIIQIEHRSVYISPKIHFKRTIHWQPKCGSFKNIFQNMVVSFVWWSEIRASENLCLCLTSNRANALFMQTFKRSAENLLHKTSHDKWWQPRVEKRNGKFNTFQCLSFASLRISFQRHSILDANICRQDFSVLMPSVTVAVEPNFFIEDL